LKDVPDQASTTSLSLEDLDDRLEQVDEQESSVSVSLSELDKVKPAPVMK
jgi:hypothetical protein